MSQVFSKESIQATKSISIDARGPRFSALLTVLVLSTALVTHSLWVVIAQAIVFAIGAFRGPQFTPYAAIFRTVIRPRLKGEVPTEDVRPPQFAQSVGLLFALTAIVGSLTSVPLLFTIALSFALAAAFLNAAFNFCLGCEIYLLLLRLK
ncbi:MAG: DUF4395 family protein [Actinobacteria bacterium]|uniref:Unannotated protein n=1 Tax=freshwater metagenome TaxID=449393 RepID=A0A6J7CEK7_9ZZZZ|nr:DUF4395 domain-containing protein [Actinomycetota bacterium]MSW47184.1 DUF4395 family protein [Actinomycetota bacterium]MSX24271.1 DUF4395 family protein [Actinomycetota bacterium]MSY46168.1 DUF4395 family protein [Actinomycetota bacterium]MSY56670.1 DUF4395 family protein [Actinomycetota bacterium]